MNQKLKEKTKEAFASVLPISAIVLLISTILVPLSIGTVVMFLVGTVFLVVGMGLFTLGTEMSMMLIGENLGTEFARSKKRYLAYGACFLVGMTITIAEPDLQVLAGQVTSVPNLMLILTVAIGVGIFLVLSLVRLFFNISLSRLLIICYIVVFALSIFTPNSFVAVAFDSGGVTTGPMTVPFILALGIGLSSMRSGTDAQDDSFGFVALGSIGPILAVMILGICYNPQSTGYHHAVIPNVDTMQDVMGEFMLQIPTYFREVLFALIPIAIFLIIFQLIYKRFSKRQLAKISIGMGYTLVGLILFLTGVNVGFIPVGTLLGQELASTDFRWILVPVGMLIGYFIVVAEPAIHVLNSQVEEISAGAISKKAMNLCLSIGVAVSVGISMLRVLTGVSIYWFLVPGYAIALLLSFKTPKIFTGIAFDSGGVASGPMTSTFLLPFVIGACEAAGGNVLTDAFGVVAMVAMTPLIAILLLGYFYQRKMKKEATEEPLTELHDVIDIDLEQEDVL